MSGSRVVAVRTAAAGAVGALLLAGAGAGSARADDNGIAGKSAPAIADASRAAMSSITSMHMVAEVTDQNGTNALDLRFDVQGNCVGTVTPAGSSGRADIIKRGTDVWMKLDDALLRAQVPGSTAEDAIALIDGRYLHGTTGSVLLRDFAEFCDLDTYKKDFASKPVSEQLTKGARTTVDGRPAVTVTTRHDGETSTFQVSTEDEPYLLQVQGSGKDGERKKAVLSDFDEPVRAVPPAPSDSVDLSQLR